MKNNKDLPKTTSDEQIPAVKPELAEEVEKTPVILTEDEPICSYMWGRDYIHDC